jgi:hypothetical protein
MDEITIAAITRIISHSIALPNAVGLLSLLTTPTMFPSGG